MTTTNASSPLKISAVLLTLAWIAFIGLQAWQRWPVIPLDMNMSDAASSEFYRQAVQAHVVRAFLLALAPPAAIWGFVALLRRRAAR